MKKILRLALFALTCSGLWGCSMRHVEYGDTGVISTKKPQITLSNNAPDLKFIYHDTQAYPFHELNGEQTVPGKIEFTIFAEEDNDQIKRILLLCFPKSRELLFINNAFSSVKDKLDYEILEIAGKKCAHAVFFLTPEDLGFLMHKEKGLGRQTFMVYGLSRSDGPPYGHSWILMYMEPFSLMSPEGGPAPSWHKSDNDWVEAFKKRAESTFSISFPDNAITE